ncbi:MAG TPA: glycosyltransferase family 2 protein [Thermoanaerobaculia bacterium]|nr:glycosyltransferase family 2 protein [Thermoanaerobaculia bacterium]
MKIVGLMTARNEDWILGLTLRAVMLIVDAMIVLDHASCDRTREIVEDVAGEWPERLHYRREDDPVWREASIRQRLLEEGRELGATHFWVVDADEMVTGNLVPRIRPLLASLAAGEALSLPWFPLWRSLDWQRRDGNDYWCANRTVYGFRDHPAVHYQTRWDRAVCDIHTRRPQHLSGERACGSEEEGGVLHFVAADWRRLVAKTAWYKMIETVRFGDRSAVELNAWYDRDLNEANLVRVPVAADWWSPYRSWRRHVDLEAPSWFEADCRRMWEEHGAERFDGLGLWGAPEGRTVCAASSRR